MGSVNSKNVITLFRPVDKDEKLLISCCADPVLREARRGFELDIITEVYGANEVCVWRWCFTVCTLTSFFFLPASSAYASR